MNTKKAYTLSALAAVTILSGFTSGGFFPAPVEKPAAAVYVNVSSSGIFNDAEESQEACEEIANTVGNLCLKRKASNTETPEEYKSLSLKFLQDSIVKGFLKIEEFYFYYKNTDEYALIANGDFNMDTIASKTGANMVFDDENRLQKVSVAINTDNQKLFLQANSHTLIISPEKSADRIMQSIAENQNKLGEDFKTFSQMLKLKPALSAEINLEKLWADHKEGNLPKSVAATKLIRFLVANRQNKFQISIPEEEDRLRLKEELLKQTDALNAIFDNKTDYKLAEGKTSLFIETVPNDEQVQAISRKAMAFMLHFFIKNIPSSDQQKKDSEARL